MTEVTRCPWCGTDPLYVRYHDEEWGKPVHDDLKHFECLTLESAQAGLSWITILRKREHYRDAYANFDVVTVASFDESDVERLMTNPGLVRNRRKIEASINNAKRFIEIQQEFGTFDAYIWSFVDNTVIRNEWESTDDIPASTELSQQVSKDLKRRGFKFLGPTTVYAHLQATGLINDHLTSCFAK
ncbi:MULTISPECIES: DNA-3-methyladenine glycosylase I [Exiguobacterium]|uniref:DNA-3-methyladenine glycosylase I n=1 Tax=Exiguobacterium TaxID=33986 RepID=UPI001BE6931D|nr:MULTISPECIES: DNA-3-methyladenine glycosylase I [Exiguobacterium]MCT4777501.1 DNA-3-methyladenine glycosylase I [Exiguobacterium aquaticum]MCT4788610.1 DNA-3-methyladenine glycosylase I [Exiguobacterium mexicanum]